MTVDTKKTDLKEYIKETAMKNGFDLEHATELAAKCYDDFAMWRPFGGATSFSEIDSAETAREYTYKVDDETYKLKAIIDNITASEDLDVDAKVGAIQSAATEYKTRLSGLSVKEMGLISRIKAVFKPYSKKPVDDEDEEDEDEDEDKKKELPEVSRVKVYKDKQGNDRWLTFSSNAFEDLDKELFTTKALEEAVEYADKTGERGPLMFFHIPGTEVGQCDLQTVVGRFLVESGTFLDTSLGAKALEYLKSSDDEHQVSIGFDYNVGDEEDGIFDWLRIKERSFLPFGTAANPWTSFKLIGEKEMDDKHRDALESVFGKELASGIISRAEDATKQLEDSQVRFKEVVVQVPVDATATVVVTPEATKEETPVVETPVVETPEVPVAPAFGPEQLAQLGQLMVEFSTGLGAIKESMATLETQVKALKQSDDEKIASMMSPRMSFPGITRPTENDGNVIADPDTIKALAKEAGDLPVNPAAKYVTQILGAREN